MAVSGLLREISYYHGRALKFLRSRRNGELEWGTHLGGSAGLVNAHSGCQ